jgi:hypothetical protein
MLNAQIVNNFGADLFILLSLLDPAVIDAEHTTETTAEITLLYNRSILYGSANHFDRAIWPMQN